MRLTPPQPVIPKEGFTVDNDIFGFHPFASRLANLVQNIDEPLVIALDAPWGSGKSVFTKQWAGLLRERGATVILFDAFRSDHYEDAFLALSAEIHATAKELLGGNEKTTRRFLNRAKKAGVALAPIALRVASRAGTAGLMSLDDVEASGEAVKAAARAFSNESAKALERAVSERLRKAGEERAVLEVFRETLSELAHKLAEPSTQSNRAFPLILIIDELDRCRPPFALSMIERIKHLFSVPGVCFVLVTHLPQLQQAVQGAYGANFDARTYLEKFYQLRTTLPQGERRTEGQRPRYIEHLWNVLEISFAHARTGEIVRGSFQDLAERHDLSLRELERAMTNVALVSAAAAHRDPVVGSLVSGLCIMRQKYPELYARVKRSQHRWSEIVRFLSGDENADSAQAEKAVNDKWVFNWWRYAGGDVMTVEEINEFSGSFSGNRQVRREEILSYMTIFIDELDQRNVPPNDSPVPNRD